MPLNSTASNVGTHCLLRYSADAGFTKTMARIHATTLGTARANPLGPVWSHSSWCSALLLSQPLFVGRPPLSVPCPDERGQKQRLGLIRAHSLTQARGREGNDRHNWEMLVVPVVAEACRKLLQPEANCVLPGELAPGHGPLAVPNCTSSLEGVGSDLCLLTAWWQWQWLKHSPLGQRQQLRFVLPLALAEVWPCHL